MPRSSINPRGLVAGLAAGLIAVTLVPPARAQDEAPSQSHEFLIMTPPEGWELAHQQRGRDMFVVQYVPPGETVEDWRQMVQAQVFLGVTGLEPNEFLDNMLELYRSNCDPVGAAPPEIRHVQGYAVSRRVLACGRNKGDNLGTVSLFKVIQGRDALYAINRAWRGPAFDPNRLPISKDMLERWAGFVAGVRLCDGRNPLAPCPTRRSQ